MVEEKEIAIQKKDGLLQWILKVIAIPFSVGSLIYAFFITKRLKNCLPGKVVLITGASSGLGEALAHTFYVAGCKVVLAARRQEELERVRKDLLQLHSTHTTPPPIVLPLDLTDLNSLPEKVKQVLDIFGQIDILVNNGGISVRSEAINTKTDVDIKIMLVNYFGTVALTKAVLPSMIKRNEGRIICIGSVQGKFAIPQRSAYAASKHALQAFCDSLRAEMSKNNVKVTLISPGYINTSLSLNALTGSGTAYGEMDAATAGGADRFQMSKKILQAVLSDQKDVIMAPIAPRLAFYIRFIWPSLYFWIMSERAKKLEKQN
ncbi:CLUMA_CG013637, isoform A [Clunio marinus]|uniref:CLUMA_CG013637, isoform A n=1 Tax=Clunio marinus TaxID=568069 RepID=A0A1J1IPE9_9DIPT|nr:CLUMA_CG013637, isoform A [Clunio marinus]